MGTKHPNDSFRSGRGGGNDGHSTREEPNHYHHGQDAGTPTLSEFLPPLDERNLSALHRVGREWSRFSGDPDVWRDVLPVDPSLGTYPDLVEIEAISNAVPAFQPVEWRNARTTLTWMICLLITLFTGTIALIRLNGVAPNVHETILSQLAHRIFDSGFMYAFTQAATAAILLLAANTAYNDFPRVLFLLARDRYAPRIFLRMGSPGF